MVGVVLPSIAKESFPKFMGSFFNLFFGSPTREQGIVVFNSTTYSGKKKVFATWNNNKTNKPSRRMELKNTLSWSCEEYLKQTTTCVVVGIP
jgi:hypothetical protein